MSAFSSWSYTSDVTFWAVTVDAYAQPSYGTPVVMKCDWAKGGRATEDATGVQFVPASVICLESDPDDAPELKWKCAIGSFAGSPPSNAETVRRVDTFNVDTFNDGLPDYKIYTG